MQTASATASPRASSVATPARALVLNSENLDGSCMVCVSGVTDPAYTQACFACFSGKVDQSTILHDVGLCFEFPTSIQVLVSRTESPGYLTPAIIAPCCFDNPHIVNFVHLHGGTPQDIVRALNIIRDECGLVHGIRVDIPGITPEDIRGALQGVSSLCQTPFTHEIILTLNHRILASLNWDAEKIVQYIRGFIYKGTTFSPCINRVAIDLSGVHEPGIRGLNEADMVEPNNLLKIKSILEAIREAFKGLPLMYYKGTAKMCPLATNIMDNVPKLSVGAPHFFHTDNDAFDADGARDFIAQAIRHITELKRHGW